MRYAHRAWLNPDPFEQASIATVVEVWEGGGSYCEAIAEIRDCSRKVQLEFGFGSDEEYFNQRLEKVDTLIKMLEVMRAEMLASYPVVVERQKEVDAQKVNTPA